jgi:acetylornithine deacetylase
VRVFSDIERRVLDAVDAEVDATIARIQAAVQRPSITGQEGLVQDLMAETLRAMGMAVDVWEPQHTDFGDYPEYVAEEPPFTGRPNVVGVLKGAGGGRSIAINGHIDVVPAGDESAWTYPPFSATRADGRIYGRGSTDMKGGLIAGIGAIRAIQAAGLRLRGDVMVQSVIGEESGGVGTLAAVLRGHVADGVLIAEPTQLNISPAGGGCLMFRITVHGRSAHAALRYEGESALEHWYPLHAALLALEAERNRTLTHPLYMHLPNKTPFNVGRLEAGNWPSSVPETLVAEGRFGVMPGEEMEAVRASFARTLADAANADPWLRAHPPELEWYGAQFGTAEIAADHPLVRTLYDAFVDAAGREPSIEGVAWGSDMRFFTEIAHVPAVLFGPGNVALAHYTDEFVPEEEIRQAMRVDALTILRWCGIAE